MRSELRGRDELLMLQAGRSGYLVRLYAKWKRKECKKSRKYI